MRGINSTKLEEVKRKDKELEKRDAYWKKIFQIDTPKSKKISVKS